MSRLKIAVLISGSGTNLQTLIDETEKGNINARIKLVIANRKNAYGLERAKRHSITTACFRAKDYPSANDFDKAILSALKKSDIDLVVLAGYLSILTPTFIATYPNRIINIHPALIPSFCGKGYYGLKVHQAAIDYGVKLSGATVHFVDSGTDTGPVIMQESVPVFPDDTPEILQKRVLKVEHRLLPKTVKLFCENKLQVIEREGKKPLVKIL